jgi:transcriptional regulator with XRE-family HTH domain
MPAHSLLGTRIRERRISLGLKQAELARLIGISASYLNLIEHNRRRIAGKLVTNIADQLKTDVASLSEGAEDAVIAALNEVMEMASPDATAPERAEDLTGRFPGWSSLIAAQQARIKDLERTVETLTDRMTHDPFLSTSLHEVISAVTSIRSTSSILRDDEGLDGEWLGRFHSNL